VVFVRKALIGALGGVLLSLALGLGPSTALAERHHRVRAGESLARIARRYRVSVQNLRAANDMGRSTNLRPGQVLLVPDRGEVFVRRGQTLSHIARENDCSIAALARANGIRSGERLRVGQRLLLPGFRATVAPAGPQDWGEAEEPGVVRLETRTDEVTIRLRDAEGRVPRQSLEALARLMHRGDEPDDPEAPPVETPAPRLALLIAAISDHFGGRPVRVVSGFREVRGFTRETSRHVRGHAADVSVAGVSKRALWDFCRSISKTGCGLYPRSSFVHVDVRESGAQWVDWSGPGRRPRYGNLRGPYRRRARRRRRSEGRSVTRPDLVPLEVEVAEPARHHPIWETSGSS
jgi:uncharacterized protein YcbK (DUF882 family)